MSDFGHSRQHTIWAEKYRPKTLDEYIGNEDLIEKARAYVEANDIDGHLLLHGPPGTGKSALAKILVTSIDCDYMYINASDQNGIDTVRTDVKHFASAVAMSGLKVMILDEFDQFTADAQKALRNPMVEFSGTTRFILTANYPEKIIPALHSRVQDFAITPPDEREAAKLLNRVLKAEGVEFDVKNAVRIVKRYYPDLRKILQAAQKGTRDGVLRSSKMAASVDRFSGSLVDILADSSRSAAQTFSDVRQLVQDEGVRDFSDAFRHLYNSLDKFAEGCKAPVILSLQQGQYQGQIAPDKEINFMATIVNIIQHIR